MSRLPRGSRARGIVFVAAVVIAMLGASIGPAFIPSFDRAGTQAYDVDSLVAQPALAEGEIDIQPREESGVVLVDISHGNRMAQDEIKPLLTTVTAAGYEVDLLESDESLDASLTRADAFVIIDPSIGYGDDEATRVEAFVDRGGRLLLVGEPTTADITGVDRPNRLTPLSTRFGLEFGDAYLFNMGDNDGNHLNVYAEAAGGGPLTEGVSRGVFYTSTSISVHDGRTLMVAGDGTRSSRTDATGSYPVAAVNGNVLALADGTFLREGNFNVLDNEVLLRNVVRFLVSGEKRRTLGTYPTFVDEDPTIGYTRPALVNAAQHLAVDLRATGHNPSMTIRRGPVSPNETDVLITTFNYLDERGHLDTGVRVNDGHLSVRGYDSATQGNIVVRAPASGFDLVIVADTPARARLAVDMLADGTLREHLINRRTAVVRTSGVVADED